MTDGAPIRVDRKGAALWITIDRQDRRNAINGDVIEGIHDGFRRAIDDGARAVVLTGAGEKAFCAGGDLQQGTSVFGDQLDEPTTDFGRLARFAEGLPLVTVARVNGACVAGGMGLLALCDLAIAADHARFGLPEARVGVFPMQVQVYFRNMILPRHVAELCFTGDLVGAARAREMGLVNEVVPASDLDAAVDRMTDRLAKNSPVAIRRGKAAMAAMQGMAFREAIAFAEAQIMLTAQTSDAKEGLAAFTEKRRPAWDDSSD